MHKRVPCSRATAPGGQEAEESRHDGVSETVPVVEPARKVSFGEGQSPLYGQRRNFSLHEGYTGVQRLPLHEGCTGVLTTLAREWCTGTLRLP